MKNSRQKGHSFERQVAQQFRDLGWDDAMTKRAARGGDWSTTDDGIDLVNTEPFAVQCKRLKNYASVNTIEEILAPPKPQVVNHPMGTYTTRISIEQIPLLLTKKNNGPTMAVLPWSELQKLLNKYHD